MIRIFCTEWFIKCQCLKTAKKCTLNGFLKAFNATTLINNASLTHWIDLASILDTPNAQTSIIIFVLRSILDMSMAVWLIYVYVSQFTSFFFFVVHFLWLSKKEELSKREILDLLNLRQFIINSEILLYNDYVSYSFCR